MPRFEVHIPAADPAGISVTLRVDAEHWMAALRTGLYKLGEQGSSVQNVLVDVQGEGLVHVTESRTGRVFAIRELTDAPEAAATLPAIPLRSLAPDERPTLLNYPRAQPLPGDAVGNITSPAPPTDGAAPGAPSESPKPAPRRDSAGRPRGVSLSPRGEIEGAHPHRQSRPSPLPKTPSSVNLLQPAAVVELERPTRAAAAGQIGRTVNTKQYRREEVDDALSDIFERVQAVYEQPGEQPALYLLLDLALEKIRAESGSVLISNAGTGELTFAAARGPKAAELLQAQLVVPPGVGIAGFSAAEGVSLALSDVQRDLRWHSEVSERLKYQTKSVLCSPMMTHGRSFGCMQLINRKGSDAFTEHEIGMLAYIAHQGALFLNSRN
jgi:hypothetical protein